jgi:ketosteroid isomerase-like protein
VSQENVEIVLRTMPAPDVNFARQLREDESWAAWAEAAASLIHPNVASVVVGLPDGEKSYCGLDGFREALLDWYAPWATYRLVVEQTLDLGDRVLVFAENFGRLEGSTAEIQFVVTGVYTLCDGQITRVAFYADRAQALRAVGLEA